MPMRFALIGSVVVVLSLAACGGDQPRPSDAELGSQTWQHAETGARVRPYEDCLRRVARETRALSSLGLERIDTVLAGCLTEEQALVAAVEGVWSEESREQLDGRIRGIRIEALRVIKETPYLPPSVVVSD